MAPTNSSAGAPDMTNVFKSHPQTQVLKDLLSSYRDQAVEHLQGTIPNKISSIRALLAAESDPTSPLWVGHVDTPAYTRPLMLQPGETVDGTPLAKVIRPSDVITTTETQLAEEDGKGIKAGAHWFEVVPSNTVQRELIQLSLKEHEDLHMISQDLRIWLELEIPVIEDGNSFGADVQGHLVRELNDAYKRSNAFQNGARSHYNDRLKLSQDWVKCPNLMDYPAAIAASDRFDHFLLRSYLRSLLVIYGGLLTKFERNWTKVINPKGSGSSSGMY